MICIATQALLPSHASLGRCLGRHVCGCAQKTPCGHGQRMIVVHACDQVGSAMLGRQMAHEALSQTLLWRLGLPTSPPRLRHFLSAFPPHARHFLSAPTQQDGTQATPPHKCLYRRFLSALQLMHFFSAPVPGARTLSQCSPQALLQCPAANQPLQANDPASSSRCHHACLLPAWACTRPGFSTTGRPRLTENKKERSVLIQC